MTDFLNACIFCFGVSAVIGAIVGHEDALALAVLAIAAVVMRLADYVGERLERRSGRKPKAGA